MGGFPPEIGWLLQALSLLGVIVIVAFCAAVYYILKGLLRLVRTRRKSAKRPPPARGS